MSRYIDADKLLSSFKNSYLAACKWEEEAKDEEIKARANSAVATFLECYLRTNEMPTADVEEVKTAVFEECANCSGFKCSRCKARVKNRAVVNETHKYCYKCGARFVGVAPIDNEF